MPSNSYANNESEYIGFFTQNVFLILSLRTDKAVEFPCCHPPTQSSFFSQISAARMAAPMSQGSDVSLHEGAEELGDDDLYEDPTKIPPPISREPTPDYLNKKNHPALANQLANHPTAAAPGAAAALIPIRSASSKLVEQMSSAAVSPASAEADAGASVPAGPASSADAPAAGDKLEPSSSDESEEEDTRTDEQKAKDKLAEDIAVEIARVEAAGFTFSKATKWAATAAPPRICARSISRRDALAISAVRYVAAANFGMRRAAPTSCIVTRLKVWCGMRSPIGTLLSDVPHCVTHLEQCVIHAHSMCVFLSSLRVRLQFNGLPPCAHR